MCGGSGPNTSSANQKDLSPDSRSFRGQSGITSVLFAALHAAWRKYDRLVWRK